MRIIELPGEQTHTLEGPELAARAAQVATTFNGAVAAVATACLVVGSILLGSRPTGADGRFQ